MSWRRVFILLVSALVASTFCVRAYAHPGGTDSSGGHTDRSTGEYHYHHGYSAHDHYDMNDDGIIDCPYDFEDNKKSNVQSSPNQNNKRNTKTQPGVHSHAAPISRSRIGNILLEILDGLASAAAIGLGGAYFIFQISLFLFGDKSGCSPFFISFWIIFAISLLCLLASRLWT